MDLQMVDINVGIEIMELMSKDLLTLEGAKVIIEALNKGDIESTYDVKDSEDYQDGCGAIRTRYLNTTHKESNIKVLAYNFHAILIKFGEEGGLSYLRKATAPPKKTYKRRYRR